MPLALVTGAAGVMGTRLVLGLLRAGWQVRALVLPNDPLRSRIASLGCEIREGNITDAASLHALCDGVDTVYHLAAVIISHDPTVFQRVNRNGTAHMVAEAERAGVRHFIYVSSASVTYPRLTPYAQSKLDAERVIREARIAYTIVRPTLVYEAGGGQEIMMFLAYLQRFPIVPFIGAGRALKRPVWSEDVASGLLSLADNPIALGKTYNFSGPEAISMLALAKLLLRHHASERPILPLPVLPFRLAAYVMSYFMQRPPLTASAIAGVVNDANLDPGLAMRELGYQPLGVRAGFERCFPIRSEAVAAARPAPRDAQKGSAT